MTNIQKIEAATTAVADPMISMLEKVMLSPDLPIERMSAIMDLRERQMNKEAEQDFNQAFASAMAEMPSVKKTGWNPHLKRNYATLDDLILATRPVLAKHGLSLNWQTGIDGEQIWVRAIVRHSGGHQITTEERGPRDKSGSMNALQGGGSTQTYLKRYSGFAILGMAAGDEVDDDGVAENQPRVTDAEVETIIEHIQAKKSPDEIRSYLGSLEKRFHIDEVRKAAQSRLKSLKGGEV